MNPRAVLPTYWCSKPDPSATWVLLRAGLQAVTYHTTSVENFQGIPTWVLIFFSYFSELFQNCHDHIFLYAVMNTYINVFDRTILGGWAEYFHFQGVYHYDRLSFFHTLPWMGTDFFDDTRNWSADRKRASDIFQRKELLF